MDVKCWIKSHKLYGERVDAHTPSCWLQAPGPWRKPENSENTYEEIKRSCQLYTELPLHPNTSLIMRIKSFHIRNSTILISCFGADSIVLRIQCISAASLNSRWLVSRPQRIPHDVGPYSRRIQRTWVSHIEARLYRLCFCLLAAKENPGKTICALSSY